MKTTRIDFVANATTREAGVYALKYGWAFAKGVSRDINSFAHRLPWVCVAVVLIASVVVGSVLVAEARMERDHASREIFKLQQQVEQLSCIVESNNNKQ